MNRFHCEFAGCDKTFTEKRNLRRHEKLHAGIKPFVCKLPDSPCNCGRRFTRRGDLEVHMRARSGVKPHMCSVPGCGKSFTRSSDLRLHERRHNNDKPFECPHCTKAFFRPCDLAVHCKRKHNCAGTHSSDSLEKGGATASSAGRTVPARAVGSSSSAIGGCLAVGDSDSSGRDEDMGNVRARFTIGRLASSSDRRNTKSSKRRRTAASQPLSHDRQRLGPNTAVVPAVTPVVTTPVAAAARLDGLGEDSDGLRALFAAVEKEGGRLQWATIADPNTAGGPAGQAGGTAAACAAGGGAAVAATGGGGHSVTADTANVEVDGLAVVPEDSWLSDGVFDWELSLVSDALEDLISSTAAAACGATGVHPVTPDLFNAQSLNAAEIPGVVLATGIKTLVNMTHSKSLPFGDALAAAGVDVVWRPVDLSNPTEKSIDEALAAIDAAPKPVILFASQGAQGEALAQAHATLRTTGCSAPMSDTRANSDGLFKFLSEYVQTKICKASQIPGITQVSDDVYISGQVNEAQLEDLRAKGVKAVLNLRSLSEAGALGLGILAREEELVKSLGLEYANVPVQVSNPIASLKRVTEAFQRLPRPVLVHSALCTRAGAVTRHLQLQRKRRLEVDGAPEQKAQDLGAVAAASS